MLRSNLFVKFSSNLAVLKEMLDAKRLPVAAVGAAAEAFEGRILHNILVSEPFDKYTTNFVVFGQDLDILCASIADAFTFALDPSQFDRTTSELTVTLVNPFETDDDRNTPPPSRKTKESLLKPYHSHLKGFKHFGIKGHFPEDLKQTVTTEAQSSPLQTPQDILDDIQLSKALSNE
jgi:hypothetical protein